MEGWLAHSIPNRLPSPPYTHQGLLLVLEGARQLQLGLQLQLKLLNLLVKVLLSTPAASVSVEIGTPAYTSSMLASKQEQSFKSAGT